MKAMMVTDFVSHGTPSASCWAPLCKWQMELPILWAWIVIPMMITTANMAICLHPNVTDSQMMTAVKGANLVAETFCCLHCNNTHQMWNETTPCVALPNGVSSAHAVAHNSNDEVAPHKFCIVTFANFKDPQKPHAKFSGMWATCHENEFWCKITLLHPSSGHSCLAGDAGPGMEVPGDTTSQGRDLVNVSGHAIPAVLYGNQYAVLFDTEPTELEDLDGF